MPRPKPITSKDDIRHTVITEYASRYPRWQNTAVTEIVQDTFGGNLAVIRATDESGHPNEEMCFIHFDGSVRIFQTTEELVGFLEMRSKASLAERLFTRPVLSGIVFIILLIFLGILAFFTSVNQQVVTVLGSAFGLAAGFFFAGSGRTSDNNKA